MKQKWSTKEIQSIQDSVISWYIKNGRHDLPWRNLTQYNIDIPYGVLVSEIMLQQTQVDRVKPKFLAFMREFPTVKTLAKAPVSEVINIWAGLGYNRRAVMLHRAAQQIVDKNNSKLPQDEDKLLALSGIGPYTARAILSFGFNLPIAVVDTNIRRFYELLVFGYAEPKEREVISLAEQFLPQGDSRQWHSAIMDIISSLKTKAPYDQQQELVYTLDIYIPHLPLLNRAPLARVKQSQFIGSKRFYRGQIINLLRQTENYTITFAALKASILLPDQYDYNDIVSSLRKDGLLQYSGPLTSVTKLSL